MQRWEALLFDFGYLGYAAALVLAVVYALTRRDDLMALGHRLLVGAALLHSASLAVGLWAESHRPGHVGYAFWSQWFASLSLFALLIVLIYLFAQHRAPVSILGVFVLPLAVFLLTLALTQAFLASPRCPFASVEDFLKIADATRRQPDIAPTFWTAVHVPLIFLAYAAFANAFGIGLAYLIGERQIKSHRPTELGYRLPALEVMDRLIAHIVLIGFPALTVGIALGAGGARAAGGPGWAGDPKVLWSLVMWGVYLSYIVLRYVVGWRGRRTAYLSLAGFGVVLFTYVGVSFFSRMHGFLQAGGALP